MNRFIFSFLLISLGGGYLPAQTSSPCVGEPAQAILHGNAIRLRANVVGQSGGTLGNSLAVNYNGSEQASLGIFTAGLWIAGLDPGQNLLLSESKYGPVWQDYTPGPLNADLGADSLSCQRWNRIWAVSGPELEAHRQDWLADGALDQPIDAVLAWPAVGNPYFEAIHGFPLPASTGPYAPFFDNDGDGLYDPFQGDYPHPEGVTPDLLPAAMLWWLFSSSQANLDVDVHETLWAFACNSDNVLNDTYFQSLRLVNRGAGRLDSLRLGLWLDFDIGDPLDDNIGTRAPLQTVFAYNNDNIDLNAALYGYGPNPPVGALTFLNRPLYKSMYFANHSFNAYPLGMVDPTSSVEHYRYINGHWRDGTALTALGSGYNPDNSQLPPSDHFFSGDPNVGGSWSMNHLNLPYADFRTLACADLGSVESGEAAALDLAFSYHRGAGLDHLQNVTLMFDRVSQIKQSYNVQFDDVCSYVLCSDDCVWPGDTDRDGIVSHRDLLAVGGAWGSAGPARDGFVNWSSKDAIDWGQLTYLGDDQKHADANGDGVIGLNDTQVIKDFSGQRTPWWSPTPDVYTPGYDFAWAIVPTSIDTNHIQANETVFLSFYFDSQKAVRGAAFEIEWDTAYWTITNAAGAPQAGSVLISQRDDTQLNVARIRIDSISVFSYGSLAQLKIKAKDIPNTQPNTTYLRPKNIKAIGPDGAELTLGAQALKFVFAGGASAAETPAAAPKWRLSPNPTTASLRIETPGEQLQEAVFFDPAGRMLGQVTLGGSERADLAVGHLPRGLTFLRIKTAQEIRTFKALLTN